ncbi:hypothetical protein BJ875DRAFT_151553 [Amylocarpus encephaloides]|uniref:CHCH domain-containing protein n=1 Tax=Amylocarpus encephaloides TaxID=45428 RepID=A0A9P7YBF2_9HELO|nr:hypothetical protein BJ875DRAFT_151553 [Amylocarpus encephaloides]
MSKGQQASQQPHAVEDDDEPDDWDKRIFSTGCAAENTKMNDCFYEKKDWRLCKNEVSLPRRAVSRRFDPRFQRHVGS